MRRSQYPISSALRHRLSSTPSTSTSSSSTSSTSSSTPHAHSHTHTHPAVIGATTTPIHHQHQQQQLLHRIAALVSNANARGIQLNASSTLGLSAISTTSIGLGLVGGLQQQQQQQQQQWKPLDLNATGLMINSDAAVPMDVDGTASSISHSNNNNENVVSSSCSGLDGSGEKEKEKVVVASGVIDEEVFSKVNKEGATGILDIAAAIVEALGQYQNNASTVTVNATNLNTIATIKSNSTATTTTSSPKLAPTRLFIQEILRRSRTTMSTLQLALLYVIRLRNKMHVGSVNKVASVSASLESDGNGGFARIPFAEVGSGISGNVDGPDATAAQKMIMSISSGENVISNGVENVPVVNVVPDLTTVASSTGSSFEPSPVMQVPDVATIPPPQNQPQQSPSQQQQLCPRRMFLASLILASKYLQDKTYSNKAWAKISGLSLGEVNKAEMKMLKWLDFDLHVSMGTFEAWKRLVVKRSAGANASAGSNATGGRPIALVRRKTVGGGQVSTATVGGNFANIANVTNVNANVTMALQNLISNASTAVSAAVAATATATTVMDRVLTHWVGGVGVPTTSSVVAPNVNVNIATDPSLVGLNLEPDVAAWWASLGKLNTASASVPVAVPVSVGCGVEESRGRKRSFVSGASVASGSTTIVGGGEGGSDEMLVKR
ncbi:hypothetical protein HDU76_013523, partial [Blyttiomyces sp. JEL0837]